MAETHPRGSIAYSAGGQIRIMRTDGTAARTLTNGRAPAWSFDGSMMAFESESPDVPLNGTDIYLVNADGSDRRRVVTHVYDSDDTGEDREPAWAPDSYRIAFTSDRAGNEDIWLTNAIGHATGPVTLSPAADHSPAWSPDANAIAFVSDRDGDDEIYVDALDGKSPRRLTQQPGADEGPSWSPDGRRIAFASDRGGSFDIYVMNADGTGVRRLTSGPGAETSPAWSLDGGSIAYTSGRPPSSRLAIVAASGGAVESLGDASQAADGAAWQPLVDLSVSARPAPARPRSRSTTVTLAVRNAGPIAADSVVVESRPSLGARVSSVRAAGARCTGTRELTCTFAMLAPGAVAAIRATWRLRRCATFALQSTVTSLQGDLDLSNNGDRRAIRPRC